MLLEYYLPAGSEVSFACADSPEAVHGGDKNMIQVRNYLSNKKGQGIVEYSVLLSFIVILAMTLQTFDVKGSIMGVFDDVVVVLGGEPGNSHAGSSNNWNRMSKSDLMKISNDDRIAADQESLANVGTHFLGMTKAQVKAELGYENASGGILLGHYKENDDGSSSYTMTNGANTINYMQGDYSLSTSYDSSQRYMYSDFAISDVNNKNSSEYDKNGNGIKAFFTYDSKGVVTEARIAVNPKSQYSENHKKLDMTVTSSGQRYATNYP